MKIAQIIAWIFLGVEAVLVLQMFIVKNVGDDAAGRGMSRGFAVMLLPVLLLTAALLYWSQQSSSKPLQWTALAVVAIPFLIGMSLWGDNYIQQLSYRIGSARQGRFSDPDLTTIARAIDRKDYAAELALVEKKKIDWEARDGVDATLLGHAVKRVLEDYQPPPNIEGVRILLAHGAPLTDGAIRPNEHLFEFVFGGNAPGSVPLLTFLLDSGADPNTRDATGLPLIHTTDCTLEKLKVLAAHGANLNAPGNRSDRPQWTALMNAAYMRQWDQALYLLEKGVPPDFKAPDGNTLETVLADRLADYKNYNRAMEPGYFELLKALGK